MSISDFYDIIKMDDIRVSIPKTSHFSIGTSPYYAHQHGLAIDIYQNLSLENFDVLSPVSGTIEKVKTLRAPKAQFSSGIDLDYLILISNPGDSEILWKIMHVNPNVRVGDKIDVGDPLGITIRNGYFAYWSSPHVHLELRHSNDAIRARGGKDFSLAIRNEEELDGSFNDLDTNRIPVEIHSNYPEMILAYLPTNSYHKIFPFYGVKASINNLNCILDGGIPHYKIGTVIFPREYNYDSSFPVYLGKYKIGTLHETSRQFGFFKFDSMKFLLNDKEIRGISLYLANFLPLIKIIPYHKNEFAFEPKSIQYLRLNSSESS